MKSLTRLLLVPLALSLVAGVGLASAGCDDEDWGTLERTDEPGEQHGAVPDENGPPGDELAPGDPEPFDDQAESGATR